MILNHKSKPANQEGPVKIYGEGPRESSENIHQHCIYLALRAYQLINQSNIRLLTRWITRLTQTQAGFTGELGVGKIRTTNEKC